MGIFYEEFIKREQITGMIFDVDGTLLDSMPVWADSGERYLHTIGIRAEPGLGKILFSKTMQQGAEYIKKTYKLAQSESGIQAGITGVVTDAYHSSIQPKPSAPAFLNTLRKAGITMAVVTSTDRPLILDAFRRLGLEQYFIEIFTCSEFGSGKDEPQIFHAAAARMQSVPSHTWVVEDGLYAIRTAKAAGYRIIGVADEVSREDEPQIRKLSDYFVTDFAMDFHEKNRLNIEKRK